MAVFRTKKGPRRAGWVPGSSTCGQLQGRGEHAGCMDNRVNPCYHIVESWDIEKMMEEPQLMSTMICYARITCLMIWCPWRLSWTSPFCLGFLGGLEKQRSALPRVSSCSIGRHGSAPDPERCQAVTDFPLSTLEGEVAHSAVSGLH